MPNRIYRGHVIELGSASGMATPEMITCCNPHVVAAHQQKIWSAEETIGSSPIRNVAAPTKYWPREILGKIA